MADDQLQAHNDTLNRSKQSSKYRCHGGQLGICRTWRAQLPCVALPAVLCLDLCLPVRCASQELNLKYI